MMYYPYYKSCINESVFICGIIDSDKNYIFILEVIFYLNYRKWVEEMKKFILLLCAKL